MCLFVLHVLISSISFIGFLVCFCCSFSFLLCVCARVCDSFVPFILCLFSFVFCFCSSELFVCFISTFFVFVCDCRCNWFSYISLFFHLCFIVCFCFLIRSVLVLPLLSLLPLFLPSPSVLSVFYCYLYHHFYYYYYLSLF